MTGETESERPQLGLYDPSFEKDGCGIGLIARPDGLATREVIVNALEILSRLAHRGAVGADSKTSDGAGFMSAIPRKFFRALPELSALLQDDEFAVGMIFSKPGADLIVHSELAALCAEFQFKLLALRVAPVVSSELGSQAKALEPVVTQIFLRYAGVGDRDLELLKIRRRLDNERSRNQMYVCSLSYDAIVYKGMVAPKSLSAYFTDLSSPEYVSPFAIVHSRFSTNTLPAWELAHPFRAISHNGEINTLRGNLAWMRAREADFAEIKPLIPTGISDSASLDHAVELLKAKGCSVAEALMILIPQAWESDVNITAELRDFYRYHSARMEPWDGPAAVCFADKREVGATLDRSGFRPCRYWILDDGTLVLSSEVGAIDLKPERVIRRGRLGPGQMIAVNFDDAKILFNDDIKTRIASAASFGEWVASEERDLAEFPQVVASSSDLGGQLARFGITVEEMRMVLQPMFASGEEPTSSMGNDTPLAILSEHPQLLYKYFRQLFAQVTNPPIDPIRESLVMSLATTIGARPDAFVRGAASTKRIRIQQPILQSAELREIKSALSSTTLSLDFETLDESLAALSGKAIAFAKSGGSVIVLSDLAGEGAPIPALLATAHVHHALIRAGLRNSVSIIIESGEPRDVHHFACLLGFGAEAVHPYLALELAEMHDALNAPRKFIAAIGKGLLTVMSKMGISCLRSYCGAQVFEAIGIAPEVIDLCFAGTPSRVGGLGFADIAIEARARVASAHALRLSQPLAFGLPSLGEIHYRKQGEQHVWNPTTISKLQIATRQNDPATYAEFAQASEQASAGSLRAFLKLKTASVAVPLEEVEPASSIVKRFTTGAMSFGSLGQEAHETLAIAMNRIGAKSNSGEGGESTDRFVTANNGDRKNSAIKQVASARFGVTSNYLVNAIELQIKVAQGAKPGEGGKLPGYKVDAVIAKLRHSTAGVTLISPPPHHDIYSIEDLAQLIFDLRRANSQARISVKLVAAAGIGTIAAGVVKAGADKILISGDGGGTGASPLSSIKYAGSPWELGLSEVQQTLVMQGLRGAVVLEADGQMRTAKDIAIAACLGAEEFGFSTAPLIVEGCIMMRKCHLNTCPVGVATQDPELRKKFSGQPEHVVNYFFFVANEMRSLLASMGLRSIDELVGRTELLEQVRSTSGKSSRLDLKRLLVKTKSAIADVETQRRFTATPKRPVNAFDAKLIDDCRDSILSRQRLILKRTIENENRAVGTSVASLISQTHGAKGLTENTIRIDCRGVGGQSFGAFLAPGLTLTLDGEANDYVGKGLSGGRIIIAPGWAKEKSSSSEVVAGNACFYGATAGEAFIAGTAGERFAVRNSGARIVVEGTGDHGCEYMTGGCVVILGRTGRNFGAGMSGGQVFVYDDMKKLNARLGSNELEFRLLESESEELELKSMIKKHARETGSAHARGILNAWTTARLDFVVLTPLEYKKALGLLSSAKELAHV